MPTNSYSQAELFIKEFPSRELIVTSNRGTMSGQGTAKVHVVGRIQSLFRQPGKQQLFITMGRNEGYIPTLCLQPEASKNQTWCLVAAAMDDTQQRRATNGLYYICSYPDLAHYLRPSEHDVNPLDSEAFSHIEVVELPSLVTDGGPLPDLGQRAWFSVQQVRDVDVPGVGRGYSITTSTNNDKCAVLQAGTREVEPWPGMRVCAHGQRGDTRELWVLEKSVVE